MSGIGVAGIEGGPDQDAAGSSSPQKEPGLGTTGTATRKEFEVSSAAFCCLVAPVQNTACLCHSVCLHHCKSALSP